MSSLSRQHAQRSVHARARRRRLGDRARQLRRRQRHAGDARSAQRRSDRGAQSRPLRRQAASLARRRRDVDRDRGAEVSGEARRLHAEDAGRRRAGRRLVAEAGVGARARGRRSARRDLVRHAAGRPVQVGGWRRFVGAQSRAVGRPAARTVVRRRRRSAGHPLDLRRPARFASREGRRVVRRRVDDARWRQAAGR